MRSLCPLDLHARGHSYLEKQFVRIFRHNRRTTAGRTHPRGMSGEPTPFSRRQPSENTAGVLAVVKRRVPDPPTTEKVQRLLQPPKGQDRPLKAVYIVPFVLVGLLDAIDHELSGQTDAEPHLEALGVRPIWRKAPTSAESAVRALALRLRNNSGPVCVVILFGPRGSTQATTTVGTETTHPLSSPPTPPLTPLSNDPRNATGDDTQAAGKGAIATTARLARRRPASAAAAPASRHGSVSARDQPADAFMHALAVQCVLNPHPASIASTELRGDALDRAASPTSPSQSDGAGLDAPAAATAAAAAVAASGIVCGGPSMPPLRSQHHLPVTGNWVRLSAAQQHDVRRGIETARRRAAAGFQSFGNEARTSASQRWAHQTPAGRCVSTAGAGVGGVGSVAARAKRCERDAPGSFLPLRACASVLHRPTTQGWSVATGAGAGAVVTALDAPSSARTSARGQRPVLDRVHET